MHYQQMRKRAKPIEEIDLSHEITLNLVQETHE